MNTYDNLERSNFNSIAYACCNSLCWNHLKINPSFCLPHTSIYRTYLNLYKFWNPLWAVRHPLAYFHQAVCNGEFCRALICNFNQLLCQTDVSINVITFIQVEVPCLRIYDRISHNEWDGNSRRYILSLKVKRISFSL